MNRIHLLVVAAVVSALSIVACAGNSTPDQQTGVTTFKQTMSQADAQKLVEQVNEAGHKCYAPCSYGPADANGNVVFEAMLNCNAPGADQDDCPLLLQSQCGVNEL